MSPQEIEALLRRNGSGRAHDESGDEEEAKYKEDELERRTALLLPVLSAWRHGWAARLDGMDAVAQKLGDGSRDVAWRRPIGDSGVLEFSLELLAEDSLSQSLQLQCLRLVGNACADTDENRARVVSRDGLICITRCLRDESLVPVAVPVLLNVLMDYEPAQRMASQARLSHQLVTLLSSSSPDLSDLVSHICRVLEMLAQQTGELAVADPSTVDVLLDLAARIPVEEEEQEKLISVVEVFVAYLANEGFQTRLVSGPHMGLFMDVFHRVHTLPPSQEPRLKRLQSALLTTLADMSGNDSFPAHHPPSSPVHQTLLAWIRGSDPALQSAACLALGNLSRSDEASIQLMERDAILVPLVELISNPVVKDSQLLHLALSFCRNLAIPVPNKIKLGSLLDSSCVPRVLAMDTLPQLHLPALSLVRLLLLNCRPNVRRICRRCNDDGDASSTGVAAVVSLFDRCDAEPTRVEASRCILTLCRALHSTSTAPSDVLADWGTSQEGDAAATDGSKRRSRFYQRHDLSRPLSFLLPQQKWPALRSEAWFILALMSRSPDGAKVVNAVLEPQAATDALVEAITGRISSSPSPPSLGDTALDVTTLSTADADDGQLVPRQAADPEQRAGVAKADRENALVLASGLLRPGEEGLSASRLALLRRLVQEGAERIATQRSAGIGTQQ
ncbi:hypothetical protein XA68_16806 [Ophiocordyceps unilateralis]|uniref:Uncharacterized protein n=1 Tax=Ophiocordyceps unilateralis TaxID=268505 RepID=A0A2A9PKR9_OPHUN|nr:hypothetical protein XA68_16806 [Ophiocordyceps unilateralis]